MKKLFIKLITNNFSLYSKAAELFYPERPFYEYKKLKNGYLMWLDLKDAFQMRAYYDIVEEDIIKLLRGTLRPEDTFYDIGAHIGIISFSVADLIDETKGGQIVCFEPDHKRREELADNMRLNRLRDRVLIYENAMYSDDGNRKLYVMKQSGWSSLDKKVALHSESKGSKIEYVTTAYCTKLDNYLNRRPPSVIKIDAEGSDYEVLKGGSKLFRIAPPRLVIAEQNEWINNFRNTKENSMLMDVYMYSFGYKAEKIKSTAGCDVVYYL